MLVDFDFRLWRASLAAGSRVDRSPDTSTKADESQKSALSGSDFYDPGRTQVPKNEEIAQDNTQLSGESRSCVALRIATSIDIRAAVLHEPPKTFADEVCPRQRIDAGRPDCMTALENVSPESGARHCRSDRSSARR
jgi:hypothetical protein